MVTGPEHEPTACAQALAIAHRFRTEIGGAYEAVAAQIEHDHRHEQEGPR